jgi:hypothetical protein
MYAIVPKRLIETPDEARDYAHDALLASDFVSDNDENLIFTSPPADWFVIGGRWSGELNPLTAPFLAKVKEQFKADHTDIFGFDAKFIQDHKDQFNKIWQDMGGQGDNPYNRSSYIENGAPDDAAEFTQELYDKIIDTPDSSIDFDKVMVGRDVVAVVLSPDDEEFIPELVGNAWVVVVDYHS